MKILVGECSLCNGDVVVEINRFSRGLVKITRGFISWKNRNPEPSCTDCGALRRTNQMEMYIHQPGVGVGGTLDTMMPVPPVD